MATSILSNLPPVEYCTIGRASEITECSVNDMLHMGYIGEINLCILVNNCPAMLSAYDFHRKETCNSNTHLDSILQAYFFEQCSHLAKFIKSPKQNITYKDDYRLLSCFGDISGLWALWGKSLEELYLTGETSRTYPLTPPGYLDSKLMLNGITLSVVTIHSFSDALLKQSGFNVSNYRKKVNITSEDIYITRNDLINILIAKDKGVTLSTLFSEQKTKMLSEPQSKERITYKQTSMIASLLGIIGFTDDELRNISEKEINDRLTKLATSKNITIQSPDKNTWNDWLSRAGKR